MLGIENITGMQINLQVIPGSGDQPLTNDY
jgi:hypothetical protein